MNWRLNYNYECIFTIFKKMTSIVGPPIKTTVTFVWRWVLAPAVWLGHWQLSIKIYLKASRQELVYLQQCRSQEAQKSKQAKTISNSTLLLLGFKSLLTDIIWLGRLSFILYCFYLVLHLMSLVFTMNQWSKHTFYTNKGNKAPVMSLSLTLTFSSLLA